MSVYRYSGSFYVVQARKTRDSFMRIARAAKAEKEQTAEVQKIMRGAVTLARRWNWRILESRGVILK